MTLNGITGHNTLHRQRQLPMQEELFCSHCNDGFEEKETIVNTNGEILHHKCFVCAQCLKQFESSEVYYEFGGRKYCEHDFQVLFAPCCGSCSQFIIGRVIKALNNSWHPNCFNCQLCERPLADQGFIKNNGRALCHDCNVLEKEASSGKYICTKCKSYIDEPVPLKFRGEPYHAYHFNCNSCGVELRNDARQVKESLYCLKCHDKMGIPICGGCRRPIEERVVTALGKHWHVDHFVCSKCERPFLGKRHYERNGLAYCEQHFYAMFGKRCNACDQIIKGDAINALDKFWCVQHFACAFCEQRLFADKSKFYDVDKRICCKKCYEKLPREVKKRLAEQHRRDKKLRQQQQKQQAFESQQQPTANVA